MLMTESLATKWQITTQFTNNKVDKHILMATDLVRFVAKQRRINRRLRRKTGDKSPLRPMYPLDSWLIDFTLEKCRNYIERFKMKEADIAQINIKVIS